MIFINDIPSFRDPEHYKVIVDDRIQKIELINGVAYQDYGHVEEGDVISAVCMFTAENFSRLIDLWNARATVTFTDTAGTVWTQLRIVMREYERDRNFPLYVTASFELWKKPATNDNDDGGNENG